MNRLRGADVVGVDIRFAVTHGYTRLGGRTREAGEKRHEKLLVSDGGLVRGVGGERWADGSNREGSGSIKA